MTSPSPGAAPDPRPGARSVERAASLLSAVLVAEQPLRPAELARKVGLPASTAHRMLSSLRLHGLVEWERDGAVRPGARLATWRRSCS